MQRRDKDFAKMLIAFGADLNPLNNEGKTPLDMNVGRFAALERSESLVEVVPVSPSGENTFQNLLTKNMDELGVLLRDCGAALGMELSSKLRREHTERFTEISVWEGERERAGDPLVVEKIQREGDDWCTRMPRMHYKLEATMKAMLEDVERSLVLESLDAAASLGIQIKEMRLLQMAGSRILFLDGGGMKGLLQIDILEQLESQTGRKVTELFDWIVGTSIGGIIALALVYGMS